MTAFNLSWSESRSCSAVAETGLLFWALVAVGLDVGSTTTGGAEVSLGLSVGWASKQESVGAYYNYILERACEEGVRTGGGLHNKLVKSQALSASLGDASACGFSEAECGNSEFWDIKDSQVIGDGADNDCGSVSRGKL